MLYFRKIFLMAALLLIGPVALWPCGPVSLWTSRIA